LFKIVLILREEHGLKVFQCRVLRKIFGIRMAEVTGEWKDYIVRSFVIGTVTKCYSDDIKNGVIGGA
jgi:hypothetical protein